MSNTLENFMTVSRSLLYYNLNNKIKNISQVLHWIEAYYNATKQD